MWKSEAVLKQLFNILYLDNTLSICILQGMKAKIEHNKKCGIYLIKNEINNKVYIGKSINIYKRIVSHISKLNKKDVDSENQHFINSWHKYGKNNFSYIILEECDYDKLAEKELYWINVYESLNRNKGYNFRTDTGLGMVPLDSTRKKYSQAQKKRFSNPIEREKQKISQAKFWENNESARKEMSQKISKIKEKYNFLQYDKNNKFIEKFQSIKEIINKYPHFKWQCIYAVCNGGKNTYMGYIWKKEQKI